MFELIRKELRLFFATLSGYIVLTFFLIATGLFLWILPGNYNIPSGGMADLQPFFSFAPIIYLFLVPVICMRLFAEEKRSGTLELLLTRPISVSKIVAAKYIAGFILVLLSILPTLIYVYSISQLALPEGNIDTGGILGSYIGLVFLAGIYVAAGVFASSITDNQIIAFVTAMVLSFLIYAGFDLIALLPALREWSNIILEWGISYHYEPMSRGVIDLSDIIYFISVILFFLWLTVHRFTRYSWKKWGYVVILIAANYFASYTYIRLDVTNDKRYTLSDNTRQLLQNLNHEIDIDVFLAGNLPTGIQKLQYATTRMLEEFRRASDGKIIYNILNPNEVSNPEEKKQMVRYLASRGIIPVNLNRTTDDETLEQQIVFPGLLMYSDSTEVSVSLLQNVPGNSGDENIRSSIESLEYELTRAIRLSQRESKKSVGILVGHGEPFRELTDIARVLSYYYHIDFISTDTLGADPQRYDALIIARPTKDFSERDKYIIDQYIMHGGRTLWCVDETDVNDDILKKQEDTYAVYRPLNIEDMLFKYGARINPDVLLDGNCVLIPVVTGNDQNANPEYAPAPWYYSPLLLGTSSRNSITNGIQPVRVDYANTIDTVGGSKTIKRTVLLSSSEYSASAKTPCPVSLSIVEEKMTEDKFNKKHLPVAVLLEDNFKSLFQYNRRSDYTYSESFRPESEYNRMIIISDGDILLNRFHGVGDAAKVVPLGYDEYSGRMYGNRDFILNCLNYLCDDEGWMSLRGRNISLYLINKTKLKSERHYWEMLNLLIPLILIGLSGTCWGFFRYRKYHH